MRLKNVLAIAAGVLILMGFLFMKLAFGPMWSDSATYMPYCVTCLTIGSALGILSFAPSYETRQIWRCLRKPLVLLLFPTLLSAQLTASYRLAEDTVSIYDGAHLAFRITPLKVYAAIDDTSSVVDLGYWDSSSIIHVGEVTIISFGNAHSDPEFWGYVCMTEAEDLPFVSATLALPSWGFTAQYGCEPLAQLYQNWASDSVREALHDAAQYRWLSCKVLACSRRNPLCSCARKYDFECQEETPSPVPARH